MEHDRQARPTMSHNVERRSDDVPTPANLDAKARLFAPLLGFPPRPGRPTADRASVRAGGGVQRKAAMRANWLAALYAVFHSARLTATRLCEQNRRGMSSCLLDVHVLLFVDC